MFNVVIKLWLLHPVTIFSFFDFCRYKELIAEDPLAAVIYLQKDVYEVVDHKCDTESKEVKFYFKH